MNCPHCHADIEIPEDALLEAWGRRNSLRRKTRSGGPKPKPPHPYSARCRCGKCKAARANE